MITDLGTIKIPPVLLAVILRTLKRDLVEPKYGNIEVIPYSRNEDYIGPLLTFVNRVKPIKKLKEARVIILKEGTRIEPHTDNADKVLHLVLQTNDKCGNNWNGSQLHMELGHLYEACPSETHSAWNDGDTERAHLMILGDF